MEGEEASDLGTVKLFRYAAFLQREFLFLDMLMVISKNRRVFQQYIYDQEWFGDEKDGEEVEWLFHRLNDGKETNMALHMVMWPNSSPLRTKLLFQFFWTNSNDISLTRPKYRHALSNLYFSDKNHFCDVATKLKDTCGVNRRFLFKFLVLQEEMKLAVKMSGPGIPRKDFKMLLPLFVEGERWSLLAELNDKMSSVFGKDYIIQLTTRLTAQKFESAPSEMLMRQLTQLLPMNKRVHRQTFRSVVQAAVHANAEAFYIDVLNVLVKNIQKRDCAFAYEEALKANRHHFISQTLFFHHSENKVRLLEARVNILLTIFFVTCKQKTFDPLLILKVLLWPDKNYRDLATVLSMVLTSAATLDLWDAYLPVLNAWIAMDSESVNSSFLFYGTKCRKVFSSAQFCSKVTMPGLARMCLVKEYYNMAFFLAFAGNAWDVVEELFLSGVFFRCINAGECIGRVATHCAIPAVVAMLRRSDADIVDWSEILVPEATREAMVRECCKQGLHCWAVALLFPNWTRIVDLLDTLQNVVAENFALGIAAEASPLPQWSVVRKLMHRCPFPDTLCHVLIKALEDGALDVAKSLMWRVNRTISIFHFFQQKDNGILCKMLTHSHPDICEGSLRLAIELGASVFERRVLDTGVVLSYSCPLRYVLFLASTETAVCCNERLVELLLQSGALSHESLYDLRHECQEYLQYCLDELDHDNQCRMQRCCSMVFKAAATPCSLQHLARLAASAALGHSAGRQERIRALRLPETLENFLYFKPWTLDC